MASSAPLASPADQAAEIACLCRELDRTSMERDVLKNDRHLRGDAQMRFRFIEQHARIYPVRLMCLVLKVPASGYYAGRSRPENPRATPSLHGQHHGRYGSPRLHAALQAEGHRASRGQVKRLMRVMAFAPRCWIWRPGRSWAGRCAITCALS
jgi:HTH-like domain